MLKMIRPSLVLLLLMQGCIPFSCSQGELGDSYAPWTFRTQYAYWDEHKQDTVNGRREFPKRPDNEGGKILNLRLHGFMFNPRDDRRTWNAWQASRFNKSFRTEPSFFVSVTLANKMKAGDTVKFDPDNPPMNPDVARVTALFVPGAPTLSNGSEYPDRAAVYGSKRLVELELNQMGENPGPLGTVSGKLTYTVERAGGDPDDAVTGEIVVNFFAEVVGERLSECNDETTLGAGNDDACDNLTPGGP